MNEKSVQLTIKRFLWGQGFSVWDLSQPRRTMQTAGLPDLIVIGRGLVVFVEVKTETGRQTEGQCVFQQEAEANGGRYVVWRSARDAWDALVEWGVIRPAEAGR